MSKKILEIEEKSIDEAIQTACREFGVTRDKLNIDIISEGAGGFFGVGSKKAKIKASLLSFDFNEHLEIKTEKEKIIEPKKKEPRHLPTSARMLKTEYQPPVAVKKKSSNYEKVNAGQKQPAIVDNSALALKARELLAGILQRMSFECQVSVTETEEKIILNIEGDGSGLLIGKRGQNLDALQYVLNKAVNRADSDRKMIMVDSETYRKRREESLIGLAGKIKEKVNKTKKAVSLSHMNAHDRRIIHLALQEDETLITKSRGEGEYRKIVILPARKGNTGRTRDEGRRHRSEDRGQNQEEKPSET